MPTTTSIQPISNGRLGTMVADEFCSSRSAVYLPRSDNERRLRRSGRRGAGVFIKIASITLGVFASINLSHALLSLPQVARVPNYQDFGRQNCPGESRTALHYADEWSNAHVDLAFNSPTPTKTTPQARLKKHPRKLRRRVFNNLSRYIYKIREFIRVLVEKGTVYVLECENGKYYVGSTKNRRRRIYEHSRRRGSKWTREHKPIKVLREYRRIPAKYLLGMESRITAELMLEYGVNNVRGAMFCSPREYHLGDIDALTKFLGHYNDLSYRKVQQRLSQTLPLSPAQMRRRSSVDCFHCGKIGHYAYECPAREDINVFG